MKFPKLINNFLILLPFLMTFNFLIIKSQNINEADNQNENQTVNLNNIKIDSLSYAKSKRMSDNDLAKKKEGTFFTGLPDISSDPITGFGFGIRSNIYWNGEKSDSLFAYTPYFAKLKINASYFTTNAREFAVSIDMPYFEGSRWRLKGDFKAQQNPTNQYFGLTQKTLNDLKLPNTNTGETFKTYNEYNNARSKIRLGGIGEDSLVSDVLSNIFRETEFMLNLKSDYSIGDGTSRLMFGYEIQHLTYKTFEGNEVEGFDPITNEKRTVANGNSLLKNESEQGLIAGLDVGGGWVSIIQTAYIYDTRDFEPDPTKGLYFEIANEYSGSPIGSEYNFDKLFIQGRIYQKIDLGPRTIFAMRAGAGNIFGNNAPFFEFQDQWSPDGSINALGGRQSLRGYRANRFLARSMWFSNIELRVRFAELKLFEQNFGFNLVPFLDMGTVRDKWQNLNFTNVKYSVGSGLRISWNQSTIISFDYGVSKEDNLFYFGIGQIF